MPRLFIDVHRIVLSQQVVPKRRHIHPAVTTLLGRLDLGHRLRQEQIEPGSLPE
jgi:hypothetical protein